jgi:membrane fusion protein (multidrug efflux system)
MSHLHPVLPLALLVVLAGCGQPPAAPPATPAAVTVLTVQPENIPEEATFVGRTVANRTVEIRARVTGTLRDRPYTEGEVVQKGDVLFTLDPREFAAALQSAEAQVAQAGAQLAKAEADFARIEPLAKAGAAPQTELDAGRATLLSARAGVTAADAALASARLNVEYATITAPFSGLAGRAQVDPGALISPSSGVLTILDQVDPIAIEFTVSEQELIRWREDITAGVIKAPKPDQLTLTARLVSGETYPETGAISFRDVRISPETGTALVRGTFPNPKGLLRAGQFVRVHITGATRIGAVLVPQSAVLQSPTGASVLTVGADGKVASKTVTLGAWRGDRWIISHGLAAGDTVIVDGVQKARIGATVTTTPATAATAAQ